MSKSHYLVALLAIVLLFWIFPTTLFAAEINPPTAAEDLAAWPIAWEWQHGEHPLYAVDFVDANHGWAVGKEGLIIRTSDGGISWRQQTSGVTSDLTEVHFIDTSAGWAIGKQGVILRTLDSGVTWNRQNHPASAVDLYGLYFFDMQRGWIGLLSGILRTVDGGITWTKTGTGITDQVYDIQFLDTQNGVLITNTRNIFDGGRMLYTSDGGETWTPATCLGSSSSCGHPWVLHFPTPNLGVAAGGAIRQEIHRSTDRGKTWQPIELTGNSQSFITAHSIHFVDELFGWAVFTDGTLLTSDGGLTWQKQSGTAQDLYFTDRMNGTKATFNGLLRSIDGGITWAPTDAFESYWLSDVCFIATDAVMSSQGWAVGDGVILHTMDSGTTWQVQRRSEEVFAAIDFVDTNHGWTVGDNGIIRATTTGGATWTNQTAATDYNLRDVHFVDATHGWIAGEEDSHLNPNGKIWRTTDGGNTWDEVAHFTGHLQGAHGKFGIDFVDQSTGYVVGTEVLNGSIHKSTDGGITWNSVLTGSYPPLNAVDFIDILAGWAVGKNGAILHTSDGGETWRLQAAPVTTDLTAVTFINAQLGYALGHGDLIQTEDGGQTWTLVAQSDPWLYGIAAPTPYHTWVVGAQSTIRAHSAVNIPPIVADFQADRRGGSDSLTVSFTDTSYGTVTSRFWDFGDGVTSTERSPSHTYAAVGTYTVTLTVNGPSGSDTNRRNHYISVTAGHPVAGFAAEPTSGAAPLSVAFTANSDSTVASWQWNFGDGATSIERNPSHTYTETGRYTVTLTVAGPGGSDTLLQPNFITVYELSAGPIVLFTADPIMGEIPLAVQFTDQSLGVATDWYWQFGDGATSTEQSPTHLYILPGLYSVRLTVTGPGGSNSFLFADLIHATASSLPTPTRQIFLPLVLR